MAHAQARPILLGLIGSPIAHSASPAMHEAAAEAVGLRAHYQLIDVANADDTQLRGLLSALAPIGFSGVNVTFPYKERVLPFLDALSPGARAIGAVNTIVVRDGRLTGHNTDTTGFARALVQAFGPTPEGPVALIGAGGVGKAVAVALARFPGLEIRMVDADPAKAEAVAAALRGHAAVRVCRDIEEAVAGATGLVNGTPVGMLPDRGSPVPLSLLRPGMWVADAVYSPLWTPLLTAAKRIGARTMTGRELAIHQALDAFALFTGREAPAAAMERAFDRAVAPLAA
ncbi:shikimate dehydrogenase [Methylobacterium platani]|uniref:Shikimate dehydrogenase (NADP(+)) n=2 Tax=Methylobacterium platani TaxID=427683 RepID=A0A179SBR8_9HYPH|nr:shikimate dehydrogenase [Methylobacterium platani]KMO20488.1 shikimate dehydrogenase [Methylobacterium platani JCM 14648]OAS25296.1 shikimate dehydrogenase [Methylobacterium platani]